MMTGKCNRRDGVDAVAPCVLCRKGGLRVEGWGLGVQGRCTYASPPALLLNITIFSSDFFVKGVFRFFLKFFVTVLTRFLISGGIFSPN